MLPTPAIARTHFLSSHFAIRQCHTCSRFAYPCPCSCSCPSSSALCTCQSATSIPLLISRSCIWFHRASCSFPFPAPVCLSHHPLALSASFRVAGLHPAKLCGLVSPPLLGITNKRIRRISSQRRTKPPHHCVGDLAAIPASIGKRQQGRMRLRVREEEPQLRG